MHKHFFVLAYINHEEDRLIFWCRRCVDHAKYWNVPRAMWRALIAGQISLPNPRGTEGSIQANVKENA